MQTKIKSAVIGLICMISLILFTKTSYCEKPAFSSKDFDNFIHEYLSTYYKFEPLAATDYGINGREVKFFGELTLKNDTFANKLPDYHKSKLREKSETFKKLADRLKQMRDAVASFDDDRKVNYNMMVARTNLINLWFYDDLKMHLAVSCPSLLSLILTQSQASLEGKSRIGFFEEENVIDIFSQIPYFLDGCTETVEEARLNGKSLASNLLDYAKSLSTASIDQLESVLKIIQEKSFAKKKLNKSDVRSGAINAINKYSEKLTAWSTKCLSCTKILGEDAYLRRVYYGYGRPQDPSIFATAEEFKKEALNLSNDVSKAVDSAYTRFFPLDKEKTLSTKEKIQAIQKKAAPSSIKEAISFYKEESKKYLDKTKNFFELKKPATIFVEPSPPAYLGYAAAYNVGPIFKIKDYKGFFYVDDSLGLSFHNKLYGSITTAHEIAPGHGIQWALFKQMSKHLSPVRFLDLMMFSGDMIDYLYSENVEGWANYAVSLPLKTMPNFYNEDELLYVKKDVLQSEIVAYIEPMLQSGRITEEEAVKTFEDATFSENKLAKSKIKTFYNMPGQRDGYHVGTTNINKMVKEIQEILNVKTFSLGNYKDFHNYFFSYGIVPTSLFKEALLNKYRHKRGVELRPIPLLDVFLM